MSQSDRYVPQQDPLLLPRFHGEVWRRRFRATKLSFAVGAAVSAATLLFWNSLPMISASADSDSWRMFFPFVTMIGCGCLTAYFHQLQVQAAVVTASEVLTVDCRPPVLFLRSFSRDSAMSLDEDIEQKLVEALSGIGPVVAIGKPEERSPSKGAHRLYVSDARWQDTARELALHSRCVVLIASTSTGVFWEMRTCLAIVPPERLLLIFDAPSRFALDDVRAEVSRVLPTPLPPIGCEKTFRNRGIVAFHGSHFAADCFDADFLPRRLPNVSVFVPTGATTEGAAIGYESLSMEATLRPFVDRLT